MSDVGLAAIPPVDCSSCLRRRARTGRSSRSKKIGPRSVVNVSQTSSPSVDLVMKWTLILIVAHRRAARCRRCSRRNSARARALAAEVVDLVVAIEVDLVGRPPYVAPLFSLSLISGSPAAAVSVGSRSVSSTVSVGIVAGFGEPGQRMSAGTRPPPSQVVSLSPRNGVVPHSGQMYSSARCRSCRSRWCSRQADLIELVEQFADLAVMLRQRVDRDVFCRPDWSSDTFLTWVKTCIRVVLNQTKKGLPCLARRR